MIWYIVQVIGDELRLKYVYDSGEVWSCVGHVAKLTQTEEVCLELRCAASTPVCDDLSHFEYQFIVARGSL